MSGAASVVALIVGITIILGFIGTVATVIYRIAQRIDRATGPDEEGNTLRDRVHSLEKLVVNGIRADVLTVRSDAAVAKEESARNQAKIAGQVRSLAAQVDVYTRVAITDIADIWTTLNEAGLDRRGRINQRRETDERRDNG